jgi:DNA-directed RNA polymerase subunit K/omega
MSIANSKKPLRTDEEEEDIEEDIEDETEEEEEPEEEEEDESEEEEEEDESEEEEIEEESEEEIKEEEEENESDTEKEEEDEQEENNPEEKDEILPTTTKPSTDKKSKKQGTKSKKKQNDKDVDNIEIDINDKDYDSDEDESDYLQKFDESIRKNIILQYHPEMIIKNNEEIETLARVVRDSNGNIIDPFHKTLPFLTKYEKARVLGERANQINEGSPVFVDVDPDVIDGYLIALKEYEERKIPFIIQRPIPNGTCEYWRLSDLENI